MKITNIALIDDDAIVRESLKAFLSMQPHLNVVGEARSVEDFLTINWPALPDIILLDVGLPGIQGPDGIGPILEKVAGGQIIMLSTYEEEDLILKAIIKGATSYVSKRAGLKAVLEAINIVLEGGSYLSPMVAKELFRSLAEQSIQPKDLLNERHCLILQYLSKGLTYGEIAEEMNVSVETIRSHVKKMYKTLQVSNKTEAISKFHKGRFT